MKRIKPFSKLTPAEREAWRKKMDEDLAISKIKHAKQRKRDRNMVRWFRTKMRNHVAQCPECMGNELGPCAKAEKLGIHLAGRGRNFEKLAQLFGKNEAAQIHEQIVPKKKPLDKIEA